MSVLGDEQSVLFSPYLPVEVDKLLQAAVKASRIQPEKAEQLFKQALQLDPACLQSYFALYKFYFYQARLQDAEQLVLAALEEASKQGGFPADYRLLQNSIQHDFYGNEAALFYLYSLKALAFIRLRLGLQQQALAILAVLKLLDPEDRSGGSVIMQLADALQGDADDD